MILLVGTADQYLANLACTYSADAVLITESNWNKLASDMPEVGYTGIEEFSDKSLLLNILLLSDKIIYYPDNTTAKFNLSFPLECSRGLLENILLLVNQHVPVTNLKNQLMGTTQINADTTTFLELADQRKTKNPQIWGAGCSFTYGTGVELHQRYINLVGKMSNYDISCLATSGASISWTADQILRSDIKKNDIVIWGLTNKERVTWYHQNTVHNITITAYTHYKWLEQIIPKKLLIDEKNSLYQSMVHIHQVINFCNKIDAKLLLVGLLTQPTEFLYLHNLPNFYQYFNNNGIDNVDFGTDNNHPGPLQHQLYADAIIKQLQQRNWI